MRGAQAPVAIRLVTALVTALVALTTGCATDNASLSDLNELHVRVRGGHTATGDTTVLVSLHYAGTTSDTAHGCAELSGLTGTLNGGSFDIVKRGEWRDTQLAGSAAHCVEPTLWAKLGKGPSSPGGTVVLRDGSSTVTVVIPQLFAHRTIALSATGPLILHAKDDITLQTTLAEGDVRAVGRVLAEIPGQACTHDRLFDVALPADDYSFHVPDLLALQQSGQRRFACEAPLVAGQQRDVAVTLTVGVTLTVNKCAGATTCSAGWRERAALAAVVIP